MKKICVVAFVLIIGLVFVNCAKTEINNSPSAVIEQYYNALLKEDAKAYCELHVDPNDALKWFNLAMSANTKKDRERLFGQIERYEETIDGDKATVRPIHKEDHLSGGQIQLKKVNGKWKIDE